MIIEYILPMLDEVSWGVGVLISFFRLYVRQVFIHTFYRDDLIVLFSGIFKD